MSAGTEVTLDAIFARLEALAASTAPAPRFMGIKTAAAYADLSEDSIRRLIERGDLAALRPVKGKVLIDRNQLDGVILGSTARPRQGRGIRRGDHGGPAQ